MVGFGGVMAGLPVWGAEKRRIEKQRDGRGSGLGGRRLMMAYYNQPRIGGSNNGDVRAEARGQESAWGDTISSFGVSN
jgi:hypothetical protein